jgi:ring-1,2-phenylacetyl-CoA epoxidase subunit PaaE
MSQFHALKVKKIVRQTADAVSIELEVPSDKVAKFKYKQGQYLTFKMLDKGQEIRRSYSICSSPYNGEGLKVAVKEVANGAFSSYANKQLKEGDELQTMEPTGNFFTELNASNAKKYVGFVAGSGITPVLSILKSVLLVEPKSTFHLIYGNKDENSVIFKTELDELKNKYSNLTISYIYSRQSNDDKLFNGRIDDSKCKDLVNKFDLNKSDEFFLCGPEEMIMAVSENLKANKVDKHKIHFELFTTPVKLKQESTAAVENFSGISKVTTIINGDEVNFDLSGKGMSVLDAAIKAGGDAPFSCKGAVCCTCRAKVLEGKAKMNMNYALSEEEVADGFILTCQAHPLTERLVVDFDVL